MMFFLIEVGIVTALFVCGCWSRRVAVIFLPIVCILLLFFRLRVGNPIGLLASGGGWIILDIALVVVVVIANLATLWAS